MLSFFGKSLKRRLAAGFFQASLIPVAVVAVSAYFLSSRALEDAALNQLTAVREIKKNQVLSYFEERFADAETLARSWNVAEALARLEGGGNSQGNTAGSPGEAAAGDGDVYAGIDSYFAHYKGYFDILLLDAGSGRILYRSERNSPVKTNVQAGAGGDSGLAALWKRVVAGKKTCMEDFTRARADGTPEGFIGTPVFDTTGGLEAVLALKVDIAPIDAFMQERAGMGETGETYLVGGDLLMRTDSRFSEESTVLARKVDTGAVREALSGRTGAGLFRNYRGREVLASYTAVGLKNALGTPFDWAIVAEIDKAEALAPAVALRFEILLAGVVMALLAWIGGFIASRRIAGSLSDLVEKAKRIAAGDLTVEIAASKREDEVGLLMRSFKDMTESLRNQTRQLTEGAETLAYSISEISATAAQLAANAQETSTSISEITTTVEEVKQTAGMSTDKAGKVAEMAAGVARVSAEGRKVTEEAAGGIGRIKEEMTQVAESIVKLNEQTGSIGKIIGSVHGIADQSNLLSVNASIEAAKAGEYGKGFAVVAQEVKTLADQSREATSQVKAILEEIRKSADAAVVATERGNEAVEKGVGLSSRAGERIVELAAGVEESARAASQIAAASREQMTGVEQLYAAMESIKEAAGQNVEGARQLEEATARLNDLAGKLKELAGRFKV